MANNRRTGFRLLVVLALVATLLGACTNGDGGPTAKRSSRSTGTTAAERRAEQVTDAADGETAVSPEDATTTTVPSRTPVTGRELLRANRVRFTRPLPVPTTAPTIAATPPTSVPISPPTTVPEPPTTEDLLPSQMLIAAAYADGKITYSQSLLYRAYALFWDPRLPEQFDGLGSTGEDDLLFTEARARFSELDADVQSELAPFLERPPSGAVGPFTAAAGGEGGYGCPVTRDGASVAWHHSGTASPAFKVWACATGDYAADIETTRALLDQLYPRMAAPTAMGPAVPDSGTPDDGGDTRIDVYLLDVNQHRERNGRLERIQGRTIAAVSEDAPFVDGTASSYMLIARPHLDDANDLRRTVIHELFHSLQYAHNFAVKTAFPDRAPWFFEASAAWAEWAFFPAGSAAVHQDYFSNTFRALPHFSLETPTRAAAETAEAQYPYGAYMWPFFMQQQASGDPAAVFDAWRATAGTKDWNSFHTALDGQLPFATSFREFAVRNLNRDLGPAITPRYDDLDPDFPLGLTPAFTEVRTLGAPGPAIDIPVGPDGKGLLPLAAQYDSWSVDSPDIGKLTLDFTGLEPAHQGDVTVLTKAPDGTWTRRDQKPDSRLELCFDSDAVEALYVITANHQRVADWDNPTAGVLGGRYTVTAEKACQAADAVGTLTLTEISDTPSADNTHQEETIRVDVKLNYDARSDTWVDAGSTYNLSAINTNDGPCDRTTTSSGGGSVEKTSNAAGPGELHLVWTPAPRSSEPALFSGWFPASGTSTPGRGADPSCTEFDVETRHNWQSCPATRAGSQSEGIAAEQPDGSFILDFDCEADLDDGTTTSHVVITGSLSVRLS